MPAQASPHIAVTLRTRSPNMPTASSAFFRALLLIGLSGLYLAVIRIDHVDALFFLTNFLLAAGLMITMAGSRVPPFSLYITVLSFAFIFYCVVPALEMSYQIRYQDHRLSAFRFYLPATIIAIGGLVLFHLFYNISRTRTHFSFPRSSTLDATPLAWRLLGLSACACVAILAFNNFSYSNVLIRGGDSVDRADVSTSIQLLYQYVIFPAPSIALVTYALCTRLRGTTFITLLVMMIAFNPPTGMARFQAAALYLALLFSTWPSLFRVRAAFPAAVVAGLFLIFPILNSFRDFRGVRSIRYSLDFLTAGHFDTFQNFTILLEQGIVTWGRQLLGVALFFVPRSVWPDKPGGSGALLADEMGFPHKNIGMNFLGEGYVNFGIAGSLFFMVVLGIICGRYDALYWSAQRAPVSVRTIYCFAPGMLFLGLRGDLLSAFAYFCGLVLAANVITRLATTPTPQQR